MKRNDLAFLMIFACVVFARPALASLHLGDAMPVFSVQGSDGKTYTNESSKGKITVFEWFNPDCPFVKKHYDSHNMQNTQKEAKSKGVTWYTISSSAKDKQGYLTASSASDLLKDKKLGMNSDVILLDADGHLGNNLFEAKTTPHMFVFDVNGKLVYAGAIDDHDSPNPESLKGANNFVIQTINDLKNLKSGQSYQGKITQPYGCSVKYNH